MNIELVELKKVFKVLEVCVAHREGMTYNFLYRGGFFIITFSLGESNVCSSHAFTAEGLTIQIENGLLAEFIKKAIVDIYQTGG